MSDHAAYTPLDDIPTIHAELRKTFRSGRTQPIAWRQHQLHQLARFVKENKDGLVHAINSDLHKPVQEIVMGEIVPVYERSLFCAAHLEEWCAPVSVTDKVADWQKGWNPHYVRRSKGVVLIITPWNYPMILSMQPLYGAISAGCCVLLKLSEFSPHYGSFIARNLGKYIDPECFRVVLGDVPVITRILEFKWDHIFYTGNGRVARIISAAAAKHLTPLTLELGGKSPVIVDSTADIGITARRILWGKRTNSGQICVSPDYVLAERSVIPQLVTALAETLKEFHPNGALNTPDYGRIVTDEHFVRLKGLLDRTKGKIVVGGDMRAEERGIEPTVVINVEPGDVLLEAELFGPILPIVAVDNVDQAIDYINDHDHPLVLYMFTTDEATKQKILNKTTSGNVCINETFGQLAVDALPFGGVGESGYGRQVLFASFENFVFTRAITEVPYAEEKFFGGRYPPYTKESTDFFLQSLETPIPESANPAGGV